MKEVPAEVDGKAAASRDDRSAQQRAAAYGWEAGRPAIRAADIQVLRPRDPLEEVRLLEERGFRAHGRTDLPRIPLAELDWSADPFADRNWVFQVHALRMVDPYLAAHEQTGDSRHLEQAIHWLTRWSEECLEGTEESGFAWYDAAAGIRAAKLAYLLDAALRGTAPAESAQIDPMIDAWEPHVRALSDPEQLAANNHALFQLHGLTALTRLFPSHPLADDAASFAAGSMAELVREQFTPDGVHREHSPSYHVFACRLLNDQFASGWYDELHDAQELVTRARSVAPLLMLPDGRHVMVGDSSGRGGVQQGGPESYSSEYLGALDNGYGIARGRTGRGPDSAYMLFLMGAHSSRTHKHADDLSFIWYERGRLLLTDSGKYGYEPSSTWREYVVSTRAHNSVEIDERDHGIGASHAYGSAIDAVERVGPGREYVRMIGRVHHALSDTTHRRTLLLSPGSWLVVIDELASDEDHSYTQWFHFDQACEVRQDADSFSTALEDGSTLHLQMATASGDHECGLDRGVESPRTQGWVSTGYLKMEPAYAARCSVRAADTLIAAVLTLGDAEDRPSPRVSDGLRDPTVEFAAGAQEVRIERVEGSFEPR